MVNKERVALLVTALRSGDFKQGKSALERRRLDDNSIEHCCLGVACRVAMAEGLEVEVEDRAFDGVKTFDGEASILPSAVYEWYGFKNGVPSFPQRRTNAIGMNDRDNADFNEIADAFEEEFVNAT